MLVDVMRFVQLQITGYSVSLVRQILSMMQKSYAIEERIQIRQVFRRIFEIIVPMALRCEKKPSNESEQ